MFNIDPRFGMWGRFDTSLNRIQTGDNEQYIDIIDVICEGPVKGLVDGKNSVYLDNVPFEQASYTQIVEGEGDSDGDIELRGAGTSSNQITISNTPDGVQLDTLIEANGQYIIVKDYFNRNLGHIEINTTESSAGYPFTVTRAGTGTPFGPNWNTANVGGSNSSWATIYEYSADDTSVLLRTIPGEFIPYSSGALNGIAGRFITQESGTELDVGTITTAGQFVLRISKAFIVSSVSGNVVTTTTAHSLTLNQQKKFYITNALTAEPNIFVNPFSDQGIKKVRESALQFRRGLVDQAPLDDKQQGVGATVVTGTGASFPLKQPTDSNLSSNGTTASNIGLLDYSNSSYPTGQTRDDYNGKIINISSSPVGGQGLSFNLTTAQSKEVDEVNIRLQYGSFQTINSETGDDETCNAIYKFQIRTELGGETSDWKTLFGKYGGSVVHSGRTNAAVSFDHTIGLNRFKPFDSFEIRIIRLTRHIGLPITSNGTSGGRTDRDKWSVQALASVSGAGLSSIIKDKFRYPFTSLAAIGFSSKNFENVPNRSYELYGKMVRIPTTYIPREYSETGNAIYDGLWAGDLTDELWYTDNPAWIFYDILTDPRYGAGQWISEEDVDLFALYRIAKYCDELVPSGVKDANGDDILEPRFRANLFLSKSTPVYKVLKDMASMFTGMLYWMDNKLTVVQDLPADPVYTFAKSNVINGSFTYESSGQKTRINQVIVTWNDPEANFEAVPIILEDREDIVRTGRVVKENAVAFGATSEGQAIRYGRWKLWTAQNQREVVNFSTGLQGAYVRPGDIINVQDADRYGVQYSGRIYGSNIAGSEITSFTLDREIEVNANYDYHFSLLTTTRAAFYTGFDPIRINTNGDPYETVSTSDSIVLRKGDLIEISLWKPDGNGEYTANSLSTEQDATNAYVLKIEAGGVYDSDGGTGGSGGFTPVPIAVSWQPHTRVTEHAVQSLTTSAGKTVVNFAAAERPPSGVSYNKSVWALRAENNDNVEILGSKKEYKVLSVSKENENTVGISAVEYYIQKYDAVDRDYLLGALPDSIYPEKEPEDVPAPSSIFVVLESDSQKPGEELRVEWFKPQEEYTSGGTTRKRDYSYFSHFELYHNIPGYSSPIITSELSHSFIGIPNNLEAGFRLRTVSVKGNFSPYITTAYSVFDKFSTNVPRVQGGIPKGAIVNSDFFETSTYSLNFEANPLRIASIGSPFTTYTESTPTIDLSGIVDGKTYNLLFDNQTGVQLAYWDEKSIEGTPFWRRIGDGEKESDSQSSFWSYIGTASISTDTPHILTLSTGSSNLAIDDVFVFEETSFEAYDIEDIINSEIIIQTSSATAPFADWDEIYTENWRAAGFPAQYEDRYFYVLKSSTVETGTGTGIYNHTYALFTDDESALASADRDQVSFTTFTYNKVDGGNNVRGVARKVHKIGGRIVGKASSTEYRIIGNIPENISNANLYRRTWRPSYKFDCMFGETRCTNPTDIGNPSYSVSKFIVINPSISTGKYGVVTPSAPMIVYDFNAPNAQVTTLSDVSVTVSAIGFSDPEFKIESIEDAGGDTGLQATGMPETSYNNPDVTGGSIYTATIDSNGSVDYRDGDTEVITVKIREKNNIDDEITVYGYITKATAGADGAAGVTVFLESEDYTVIYAENGTDATYNNSGATDTTLTFTGTANNISSPEFRFTFTPGTGMTSSDFTGTGYTNFGSWVGPDTTGGTVATATIPVPTYHSSWEADKKTGAYQVKVEVRDSTSPSTILAFDTVTVQGIHALKGGYWISFSNEAHTIPADSLGIAQGTAGANANEIVAVNSGTTVEVGKGSTILRYISSGSPVQGEYTISAAANPTDAITVGTATPSNNNELLTYGDHTFNTVNWDEDSASIAYTITLEDSGETIDRTQSFTKSKTGFSGVTVTNTNPFESVPIENTGRVLDYSITSTEINVFMFGISLPYYSAAPTPFVPYWKFQGAPSVDTGTITVGSLTPPSSNDLTGPATYGPHSGLTSNSARITYTVRVYLTATNFEDFTTSQTITKNTNASNISAYLTKNHYIFDGDTNSPTPSTGYSIEVSTTVPSDADEYVTVQGGTFTNETELTSSNKTISAIPNYVDGSGNLNYPITYTTKLYNWDGTTDTTLAAALTAGSATLLDTDTVTLSASKTPKDGIVLELTNDNETVGGPTGSNIGNGSATVVTTTANIFQAGSLANTGWTFAESGVPSNVTASMSGNTLNITQINADFVSADITITATHTAGDFSAHSVVFTLSRVNDAATFRIVPNYSVVTYNPNTTPGTYDPSNRTVTFSFYKIENGVSSAFSGRYKVNNGSLQAAATSYPYTFPTSNTPSSVNIKLYNATGTATLLDEETVPFIEAGEDGDSAKALSISPDHQLFARQKDNTTYAPTAIKFTANKQNITGTPAWSGTIQPAGTSITFYTDAAGTSSTSTGNTVYILDNDVTSTTSSVVVTATLGAYSDTESVEVIDVGSDAITVSLSNDNHTFPANLSGTVQNITGSGTNIAVYEGAFKLTGTLATSTGGLSNGQFRVVGTPASSTNGPTVASSPTVSSGEIVYGNVNATTFTASSGTITFSIEGKTRKGDVFTTSKAQSFSKALQGTAGAGGADSKVVQLTAADYSIVYDANGLNPSPSSTITLTATASNFTDPYFKFTGDGFTDQTSYTDGTGDSDTFSWTVPATYFSTPQTVRVGVSEAAASTTEVAFDTITLTAVKPGSSDLSMVVSGGVTLDSTGTIISKSGTTGWNAQAYSGTGFRGGIRAEWKANFTNRYMMLGINEDPATDANYTSLDYAFYMVNNGTIQARESGTNVQNLGSYAANDILSITYDNEYVRWYKNGVLLRSVLTTANRLFHFDSSIYTNGANSISELSVRPYAPGADAYTVVMTNEAHTLPKDSNGNVTYTGSGTVFEAYRGATQLTAVSGTPGIGQFKVTAGTDINISVGTQNPAGTFGNASNLSGSASTASIAFAINLEGKITVDKLQTFSVSVDGSQGATGVSYTGTTEYYRLTNSSSPPSRYSSGTNIASGWSTTPQNPTSSNQYLWNFNRNSKSDGSFTDSAVSLITQYVQDGKGISSIDEWYQRHTSGTSVPTGTWSTSFTGAGSLTATYKFMWNRTRINYTDGTTSNYIYTVIAVRGDDGASVTGPPGPSGFMYFVRSGTGTGTGTAGVALGQPSTTEAPTASLSVGQIAICSNSANPPDQQGWRYTSSGWSAQEIVNSDIIFANAIGAEQLQISSNATGSSRIFFDGSDNNSGGTGPRILVFDSSTTNPRVILGYLN